MLRGAAFYASPAGEPTTLEGALSSYWSHLTDPDKSPGKSMVDSISLGTFVQFVHGTSHTLNNVSSVLTSNGDFLSESVGALHVLTEVLASSPEIEAALRKALADHPLRGEIEVLINALNESLPKDAQNTGSLFGLIASVAADMKQNVGDLNHGTRRIVSFTHGLQEIYQKAGDPAVLRDPIQGLREAEAKSKTLRPQAPLLETPTASAVTVPVLMVEDDPDLAEMVAAALRRDGFTNLLTAASLHEALVFFERHPGIQLVFADYNLSGTETGLDLVRLLKERNPDLKVLFTTGNKSALDKQMTPVERAVYEVFPKPVEISVVAGRLRKLLELND